MRGHGLIYTFIFILGIAGCASGSEKNVDQELTEQINELSGVSEITFRSNIKDLGTISAGEQIITYFKYDNTGDGPLLINSIKAGCGCTVPKWNKEPLKPGESEDIKVLFDSSGKKGNTNIRITVKSNARNSVMNLAIKAIVTENQ